jgi:translocation and assembly module TamB
VAQTIFYRLTAYTGKNPVVVTGSTRLNAPNFPTQLKVVGENVLVLDTFEYKAYASGYLDVYIAAPTINITGNLLVPEALFRPTDISTGETLPTEMVYIGGTDAENSPWAISLNVQIKLGNNVIVDSLGLRGLLGGSLILHKAPQTGITATGRLTLLEGSFTTFGHKLNVDPSSSVNFIRSPLLNPNLNIRVSREVRLAPSFSTQAYAPGTLTVGLDIQGTLRRPHTNLYGTHSNLSQADIISYLIFGHPSSSNSPSDVSLLVDAVSSLKIGGGSNEAGGIVDQITQGLGLSEFGIESSQTLDLLGTTAGWPLHYAENLFTL